MPKKKLTDKPLVLSVPKPCSENWERMQPREGGRFCDNCQNLVIDFSGLSDKDLHAYFSATKEIPCGRFHPTQLNRCIQPPQPKGKFIPLIYKRIAAALAFLTLKQTAAFPQSPSITTVQPVKKNSVDSASQPAVIAGTVKNTEGLALEGAVVNVDGKQTAVTNKEGKFRFKMALPLKASVLNFSHPGLVTAARSYHPAMGSTSYAIALDKPLRMMPITMGMPVWRNAFEPRSFEMSVERLTNDLRARLAEMAAVFRNNPNVRILLVAYGTSQKEIRSAERLLKVVKTYFEEREGIAPDRFFLTIKPTQKGKERVFDVEPYDPSSQD